MPQLIMRRCFLVLSISLALIGALTACTTTPPSTNKQAPPTPQTTASDQHSSYPSYLPGNGQSVFADSLGQASGSQWNSYSSTVGSCRFIGGAYVVHDQSSEYFMSCPASGIFSNFAFEVQMTVTKGDCGGVVFRSDDSGHFYKFFICQNGLYRVVKNTGPNGKADIHVLTSATSSAITRGLNRPNKIAVVVSGSTLTFYVNQQKIDQEQDSSYASGVLGLIAHSYPPPSSADDTTVAYTHARLWTL